MMRMSRILRDYTEAGAVNAQIALWGFVDDHTFLTKAGHVGLVYRMRGQDAEGLTHDQRRMLVHAMEAALRLLDDRCQVYQYVLKTEAAPFITAPCVRPIAQEALARRADFLNSRRSGLFTVDHYLVLIYEPPTAASTRSVARAWREPREALRNWLSHGRRCRIVEADLDRAITTLRHKAKGVEAHLADVGLERLDKERAFAFFRRLVNYDPARAAAASLVYDTHLDYFVADSPIECHRDHLMVGRHTVKVLTMKEPPARTFAHMLADMLRAPGQCVACLEWQRLPADRVRPTPQHIALCTAGQRRPPTAPASESMDVVHDALADGRPFRVLTVVDQWSRQRPILETTFRMSGATARRQLTVGVS